MLCFPLFLQAGSHEQGGARAAGLGGASVTLVDVWSTINNPGTLAWLDHYAVGAAFATRYFLPEAGLKSIAVAAPLGKGTIGLSGHSMGYKAFSDNRLGLAYAISLSDYLSLGVQVDYVQTRIGDIYGSRSAIVGEVGLLVKPNKKTRLGVHVYNPNRAKLAGFDDERIPTLLRLGGQYLFSTKVSALLELDKDIDLPLNIRTGIEYMPVEQLFVRAGFTSLQGNLALGLGYKWKAIRTDVSATWNQNLGYSTAANLVYTFGKRGR